MADYTKLFDLAAPAAVKAAKNQGATTGGNYTKILDFGSDLLEKGTSAAMAVGESVGEGLDYIQDAGTSLYSTVTAEGFGTAQARAFTSNLLTPGSELNESMLNESDITALKEAVTSARSSNRGYFTYDDFNTKNEETLKRGFKESFTDPKARMAHFVGSGGKIYTDDEGNTIVEDLYDFNPGPRRVKFWEGLKAGTIDTDSLEDASPIELLSILAYAAQETRKQSGKEADSKIRINLGKLGD
jgi:hypothetical protein